MNKVLRKYLGKFVEIYLDNVIIHSRTKEKHIKHVRVILQKIRKANLKLKPTKCKWFKQKLTFIEHRITVRGIESDPKNIEKIKNIRMPNFTIELRGFLGTVQFYRQFIKDYADVIKLIYNMLKNDIPEYQKNEQQVSFDTLKDKLMTASIRAYSNFDKLFKLYTDISDMKLEVVLVQDDEQERE